MSKVNVISGFLGAGKTTFIKVLLENVFKGQKVVLIENEFGEIGIDGGFLKEAGIEITEMNSGCICCTLVGDFSKALNEVINTYEPDRIIIEPSGVGKLSDVEKAIKDVEGVELESGITVVDAKKAKKYLKNFGEFFNNQVEHADTVVLSRTSDIDEDVLHETLHIIRDLNKDAAIITTPWDELDKDSLIKALSDKHAPIDILPEEHHHHEHEEECHCKECESHHHGHDHHEHEHEHHHEHEHEHEHHHEHHDHEHHHHHADEVFQNVAGETVHKYSIEELNCLLKNLSSGEEYGHVLRAKGIVSLEDNSWVEFDLVPEEYEIRPCNADFTGRLVVIGADLKEEELRKILHI